MPRIVPRLFAALAPLLTDKEDMNAMKPHPMARTVVAVILAALPATAYAGPLDSPAHVNSCSNVIDHA